MQLILITGLSGSGKSVALNVLEDSGYRYVDNLPPPLLREAVELHRAAGVERLAVCPGALDPEALAVLPAQLAALRGQGIDVRLIFLEAKTDTLIRRFSETRRRHPLSDGRLTLTECIERERRLLADLAELGQRFDTSEIGPHALRAWIKDFVELPGTALVLLFESFGYKHGVPLDADLVFDVRCLPNPNYDPRLQPLTGLDPAVAAFLEADAASGRMLEDIHRFLADWLPAYAHDNRSYVTVAIGCTGGRHRSVYCAEALAARFRDRMQVLVRHRELS